MNKNIRWLQYSIGLILLIISLISFFNYKVDSSGVFGNSNYLSKAAKALTSGKMIAGLKNIDERLWQDLIIKNLQVRNDVIAIGSSTTMQLRKGVVSKDRINFFNHSVAGASLEDYIAIVGAYESIHGYLPSVVILGIDPWVFNKNSGQGRWVGLKKYYDYELDKIYGEGLYSTSNSKININAIKWKQIINFDYTVSNIKFFIRALLKNDSNNPPLPLKEIENAESVEALTNNSKFYIVDTTDTDDFIIVDDGSIYYPYKYPKKYFISRVKQDFLSGNSFLGFMSTSSFADSNHTFSIDGMANLFENKLSIDGQIIMTSDKYKGIYGSISYYPSGLFSGWVDYYYYDKGLNIDELGYLWRDDYTQTKIGLKFQTIEPWNIIRNASFILEGDMEENTSGLDLGKSIELNYDIQFDNFWNSGGGLYKIMDYYDDRKIIHDYDRNEFGPHIFIPEITGFHINITTDKHQSLWASMSLSLAKNSRDDLEKAQFTELTYKLNSYSNFSILYDHYDLNKKYHWLESFWEDKDRQYHHIFTSLHRTIDVLTFRSIVNISRKLSFQGYLEIYSNYDKYSNYTEYLPATNEYTDSSNYVNGWSPNWAGQPLYTTSTDSVDLDISFVDPNFDLQFHPKYTDFRSIIVIKWNYMKGSNLYFVYSNNKAVDGHNFNKINQLGDFLTFNHYEPWVETLRDQSIMVKIDYWFEK